MSMRFRALSIILLTSLPLASETPNRKTPADAFAAIEKWHGTFSITVRGEATFPYAGQSIRRQYKENLTGSFTLVRTDLEGGRVWSTEEGSIGGTVSVEDRVETTIPEAKAKGVYVNTTQGSGGLNELVSGSKAGGFTLSLDGDSEYGVSGFGACKVTEKGWMQLDSLAGKGGGMGDLLQGFGDRSTDTTFHVDGGGHSTLPKQPGTLSGSSWKDEGEGRTVDFRWTVSPGAPAKSTLDLAPVDEKSYQAWIPAPLDDPKIPEKGTRLAFRAELKPEKGKKVAPLGRIDFELTDVSENPGVCTNYPKSPSPLADLRFAPQSEQAEGIVIDDPKHAHSRDANGSSATVQVEATDTGAYGTLRAKCTELGLIGEYKATGERLISIPRDENHNHVADQWEKERGVFSQNHEATWDEDAPKQRRYGDGYTLFEEYRGFVTKDGFVRTDPQKKDLFVYDPDGLVKEFFAPGNPAGVTLHYLDPTMMEFNGEARSPENRWVNFNSHRDTWYARQYALYVVRWTSMQGGGAGMPGEGSSSMNDRASLPDTSPLAEHDHLNGLDTVKGNDPYRQALKDTYVVKIAPAVLERMFKQSKDPATAQQLWQMEMPMVVMHEVGHAIGIKHHAPEINEGIVDCVMRYRTGLETRHARQLVPMTRYCRKGETWLKSLDETNADGDKAVKWERHASDECWDQVDIKSDP